MVVYDNVYDSNVCIYVCDSVCGVVLNGCGNDSFGWYIDNYTILM